MVLQAAKSSSKHKILLEANLCNKNMLILYDLCFSFHLTQSIFDLDD